jgi:hypothetical protein
MVWTCGTAASGYERHCHPLRRFAHALVSAAPKILSISSLKVCSLPHKVCSVADKTAFPDRGRSRVVFPRKSSLAPQQKRNSDNETRTGRGD